MTTSQQQWDARFSKSPDDGSITAPAEDWSGFADVIAELKQKQDRPRILDLGCGVGMLSRRFADWGFDVTALDFSAVGLGELKSHSPDIKTIQHDITKPLPFKAGTFDLVVAALSVHYFDAPTTHAILAEIARVLKQGAIFIGSVCSIKEATTNHADLGFAPVHADDPNFCRDKDGKEVRFFDSKDLAIFFDRFKLLHIEHRDISRMHKVAKKCTWEFVCRNDAPTIQ